MDGYARVLIWVFPILGRDGVLLLGHGLTSIDVTLLENHGRIAKYEVHGAINVTFTEELTWYTTAWSAPTRRATAWCFAGPA
ncbi:hypothetical protein CR513_11647, partial [Mucuna pruriens]